MTSFEATGSTNLLWLAALSVEDLRDLFERLRNTSCEQQAGQIIHFAREKRTGRIRSCDTLPMIE